MPNREHTFKKVVWDYYRAHGRHGLPWRRAITPYRILVSECMLQQTQVDRVVPKFGAFLRKFPSLKQLSEAPLGVVLREWQGLGYNRRAKNLHMSAERIAKEFGGRVPKSFEELVLLPGVGPYTAGAVQAFAFNVPSVFVETNIRSVYLHHFFRHKENVPDTEIVRLTELTLDYDNPREWYWALMDYGAYVKKKFGNPNERSKHYGKQSKFKGSDRQIRGAIIRFLTAGPTTRKKLHSELNFFEDVRIDAQLEKLVREGMVVKDRQVYSLP